MRFALHVYFDIPLSIIRVIPEYTSPSRYKPTSRGPFSVTYGSPPGAGGQGNDITDSFLLRSSRAKRSKKTTSFNHQLPLTTQTITRRQRRERNGPRLFCHGTEAFGFAAASSLGCCAMQIPLSAPRFAISSSPRHLYYVLQSRIVVLSLYRSSIRFATDLRHLPFSTFQVSRSLPSCSQYLTKSVESRYTTAMLRLAASIKVLFSLSAFPLDSGEYGAESYCMIPFSASHFSCC